MARVACTHPARKSLWTSFGEGSSSSDVDVKFDFYDPSTKFNLLCNTGKPQSIQPFPCIYKYFYNLSPMICALSKIGIGCIPNYCMTFLDILKLFLTTL